MQTQLLAFLKTFSRCKGDEIGLGEFFCVIHVPWKPRNKKKRVFRYFIGKEPLHWKHVDHFTEKLKLSIYFR